MNELVMEIIKIFVGMMIGTIVLVAINSVVQYFRLYRPLMKAIKNLNVSETEEAK